MIIALLGVVVGFVLAAAWDVWKADQAEKEELERATRSVGQEVDRNLKAIDTDLQLLAQDNKAADASQEVVTPIIELLVTGAGDVAFLRGSFDRASPQLSERVREVYLNAAIANRRIEARENYRMTNGAMSNFHTRRKMLNNNLEAELADMRRQFEDLRTEINKVK